VAAAPADDDDDARACGGLIRGWVTRRLHGRGGARGRMTTTLTVLCGIFSAD